MENVNDAESATIKSNTITHTCETSQLLSELQDNAMCMCQLDETNFVEASDEKTFLGEKNKQLIIYNDEGCMKGIEVDKCITSDPTSNPQDFAKVLDIFAIEACTDDDISNIEPPEKNKSISFEQKSPLIDDLGADLSGMPILMPQTYPEYTTKKTVGRKRRRKRGPKKGQARKPKSNVGSPKVCHKRFQDNDQHSLQRTYTQVVEEVHVANVGRPRRNVRKKSASEMLMLKRRIVHSTSSYEYKPQKIHNQLNSNNDSGIFGHIQNSRPMGSFVNQTSGNKIVKHVASSYPIETGSLANQTSSNQIVRHASSYPIVTEKYGPDLLPPGWDVQVVTRKTGKTAGDFDVYFIGPDGKRIRSKIQLASYLEEHGLPYSSEEFCFRKRFYKTANKI